jgi:hypothetical protein
VDSIRHITDIESEKYGLILMKAIVVSKYGKPEGLKLIDVEKPSQNPMSY